MKYRRLHKWREVKVNLRKIYPIVLILMLGVAIYSNTFNAPFYFDDNPSITDNPAIKHIQDIGAIWSFNQPRFLTYLSLAVNYSLGSLNVFGYHLFNLIIHILSSILVYLLMLKTFDTPAMRDSSLKRYKDIISLFSALLFVSHPIQTQAVTYIVQRAACLATLFYLLSLSLYVRFRLTQKSRYYILSLITAFLGIFTKEIFITLPLAILLYELCFFGKEALLKKIKPILPFLLVPVVMLSVMFTYESYNLGEVREVTRLTQEISRGDYLLTEFNVLRTYLRLLFLPIKQNLDYDYPIYRHLSIPTLLSLLLHLAILAFGVFLFRRKPLLSFGIFFFFLSLSIESSIFPIPDVIFEHRLYLSCFGFSIFFSSALMEIIKRKRAYIIFFSFLVIILSLLTYKRNLIWKDELSLWQDVAAKSPHKARAYNNLALAYRDLGKKEKAIALYKKAIEINPSFAKLYSNLGVAYRDIGKNQEAIALYKKAIELKPNLVEAYNNLANVYRDIGKNQEAIALYKKAIEIKPTYAEAYYNLGFAYSHIGKKEETIALYKKAIELKPDLAETYINLGVAYRDIGKNQEAIASYKKAIEINPSFAKAYNNLANVYRDIGKNQEAIALYKKAIELKPNLAEAYNNLSLDYYHKKQHRLAIEYCDKAKELGFNNPTLLKALKPYRER